MDAGGFSVCNTTAGPYEQQRADARLIAAAPELLDVAVRGRRLLLEICEEASFPIPQVWIDAVDAAIAKATGAQLSKDTPA